ncbi:MAG TPA: polysaccharide deacetylase family protein [Candidatus Eisenbacteria bacterium]|nr:polysaccharide deacetylase family protein [Candidatus Eisenbacteria bacterium]
MIDAPTASAPRAGARSLLGRMASVPGLLGAAIRLSDRLTLARRSDGRVGFPWIRPARERSYQIVVFHRVNDEGDPHFAGVPVETFREQADLFARHWTIRPLRELVESAERGSLPPRAAAITFDDGYRDNYRHAFPILAERRLAATVFLATGAIETGRPLWHDRIFDAFGRTRAPRLRWSGLDLPMETPDSKRRALHALLRALRAMTPAERDASIPGVLASLDLEENPALADRMLTWDQIREMKAGGIDFGAHTVSHPILTRMPLDAAMREILESRREIEARTGEPVDLFAYPNGTESDFDRPIQEGLRAAGFRAAVTTVWGTNVAATDRFALRRVGPWGSDPRTAALRLGWYRVAG